MTYEGLFIVVRVLLICLPESGNTCPFFLGGGRRTKKSQKCEYGEREVTQRVNSQEIESFD